MPLDDETLAEWSAAEAAEDERFAQDYVALVQRFREQLRSGLSAAHLCGVLARVCGPGPRVMPSDDDIYYFAESWGVPWVLRALACATEIERPLPRGSVPSGAEAHAAMVQRLR